MTNWGVVEVKEEQDSVVFNAMLILEKLNNNIISMAQTISSVDDQAKQNENISQKLEELAFESNLLALSASLEEVRASEIGEERSLVLAKKIHAIAMKAADATQVVGHLLGECQQIRHNLVTP